MPSRKNKNALLDDNETALASAKSENMVNLLVEHGANVDGAGTFFGRTYLPLHSSQIGNEAFKALLDKGASLDKGHGHDGIYLLETLINDAP